MNELVQYVRLKRGSRKGEPRGVVVATANGVGWSHCNVKAGDTFNRQVGIAIARTRSIRGTPANSNIPHDVMPVIEKMSIRRQQYFKTPA
jgi:hypothetical protein